MKMKISILLAVFSLFLSQLDFGEGSPVLGQLGVVESNQDNNGSKLLKVRTISFWYLFYEFSIDSAYSSEYCFTPEEIEEFTNEFETLTNLS